MLFLVTIINSFIPFYHLEVIFLKAFSEEPAFQVLRYGQRLERGTKPRCWFNLKNHVSLNRIPYTVSFSLGSEVQGFLKACPVPMAPLWMEHTGKCCHICMLLLVSLLTDLELCVFLFVGFCLFGPINLP